ncbi:MAG: sulfite exporter TauE/SafE family protein [Flammeovirgaceae bacterium]
MSFVFIAFVALFASLLTFFSGFGLGTILTPAFVLFFPVEIAVALTGVVHFSNNVFKLFLLGKYADKQIVIKFGIPAMIAALIGSQLLLKISDFPSLYEWNLGDKNCQITIIKLTVGIVMLLFTVIEVLPFFKNFAFEKDKLLIGGLLSGFFGGLSGHQGALRSMFLIKCALGKETFIATGVLVASMIDITRLSTYSQYLTDYLPIHWKLILTAILAAFLGAYWGNKLLKKVTYHFLQKTVAIFIGIIAFLLIIGVI